MMSGIKSIILLMHLYFILIPSSVINLITNKPKKIPCKYDNNSQYLNS